MKLVAGVVLAGAVAGVAAVSMRSNDNGGALPAETPASGAKEHAHDAKFRFEPIMGVSTPFKGNFHPAVPSSGILNGPGMQADFCDTDEMDVDDAGNVYWTEAGAFNILRKWNVETELVTTIAGSVCGRMDGPAESARFGGWGGGGYSGSNLQVTGDGKHIFIADGVNGLRHLDVEAGTVGTIGRFVATKEKSGAVYVFSRDGKPVPPGKGYTPLETPKLDWVSGTGFWAAFDRDKGRIYAHGRGGIYYWDVKTGKAHFLTWGKGSKVARRATDTSGPLASTVFQCPVGISISPGGRYLYVGGGDSSSFWRLDLEKEYVHIFSRDAAGVCSFQDGKEFSKTTGFCKWPSTAKFASDGTGYWSSPSGIFRLAPVK